MPSAATCSWPPLPTSNTLPLQYHMYIFASLCSHVQYQAAGGSGAVSHIFHIIPDRGLSGSLTRDELYQFSPHESSGLLQLMICMCKLPAPFLTLHRPLSVPVSEQLPWMHLYIMYANYIPSACDLLGLGSQLIH